MSLLSEPLPNPVDGSTGTLARHDPALPNDETADGRLGARRGGGKRWHHGIDIQAAVGTEVFAVKAGTVTVSLQGQLPGDKGAGNMLSIFHSEDGTTTKYMHLLDNPLQIGTGTIVTAGQWIGWVGVTGNVPTHGQPHLHFEVWSGNKPLAPLIGPGPLTGNELIAPAWKLRNEQSWRSPKAITRARNEYNQHQAEFHELVGSWSGTYSLTVIDPVFGNPPTTASGSLSMDIPLAFASDIWGDASMNGIIIFWSTGGTSTTDSSGWYFGTASRTNSGIMVTGTYDFPTDSGTFAVDFELELIAGSLSGTFIKSNGDPNGTIALDRV